MSKQRHDDFDAFRTNRLADRAPRRPVETLGLTDAEFEAAKARVAVERVASPVRVLNTRHDVRPLPHNTAREVLAGRTFLN